MKKDIHPKYYEEVEVVCTCGNKFTTGSTLPGPIQVEICGACHPFYTGKSKFVDTTIKIEKFVEKRKAAQEYRKARKTSAKSRAKKSKK